ncbi:MAG TPA: EAL domain-containing protein [Sphingomonadaceae bacterium]
MEAGHAKRLHRAGRDVIGLGIAAAAIILFIGTGGSVMPRVVNAWLGMSRGPEVIAANALILNIALIIFGWRRYIDLTQEIRERELAEERAQRLAETDVLTGLLNRRSIGAESGRLIEAARAAQRDVALLLLGIDNFKQINEIYGHETGDQVLVETARRLESLVPGGGALARLGSDEFIVVLAYEIRGEEAVDRLAANLIETLAVPIELENRSIKASLSVGLARTHDADEQSNVLNNPQLCFQSLLRQADIAMSQAKKHGRKHYAWFEPSMENELRFRNELEIGIRQGIPAGEFIPYYEQQIDVGTGELVGFEMLARWRSPQLGLVSPDIFIPITEEIDLIGEVSESLMRLAFEDAKTWDPKLTLSINVSPVQLRDPWFSQKLLRMLVESGFPAARLDIEITESCLHQNFSTVRTVMGSLKNQGIHLTLDDFGTGYSSLAQLRSLPFDRLKIDRSFVAELTRDQTNSKIVEAIISLARGLGLPITVEGIENAQVLDELRKMGDLVGQGYFYGRPENAAETSARLAHKKLLATSTVIRQVIKRDPAAELRASLAPPPLDRKAS